MVHDEPNAVDDVVAFVVDGLGELAILRVRQVRVQIDIFQHMDRLRCSFPNGHIVSTYSVGYAEAQLSSYD